MQDSSAVPLTSHTAGRKQTSWFVWTPWCFAPSSVQGRPFNLLQHCSLIATLRHTRALLTANALLTSSAANQMSGKTTSRNVNNANCGQPRGPIGACACRLLQLCLPLPLSVHLRSPSLSFSRFLNRRLFVYFCCRWRSTLFFFVSCRRVVLLREKENSPSAILLVAASSSWSVREKNPLPWSVISVTQSPRSTKIMMNVRGKLPTRI